MLCYFLGRNGVLGMHGRWIGAALVSGLATVFAGSLSAQQRPSDPGQPIVVSQDDEAAPAQTSAPQPAKPAHRARAQTTAPSPQPDPNLDTEDQLAPSQIAQPMPAAVATPGGPASPANHPAKHASANAAEEPGKPARLVVACSGAFSKDSSNLKLAMVFDSRNVTFTDIDFNGSKVGASILFEKDPKKRLEIWWSNPANRSGTYLILINGQSTWSAPGGLRLRLALPQIEKLNHKPFKLKGFDKDNVATVSDWDDGALATMPGGCKSGVSLQADPKAPADAIGALPADHEYSSTDSALRAVKPTISEILIGY
jgi:hypothetical protein